MIVYKYKSIFSYMHSKAGIFVLVALAYFLTAKLGLMVQYKESVVTLIWLPTGIAVGSIMRWGNISLPAIFLAAFLVNFSADLSFFSAISIAIGNTLAPYLTTFLLQKFKFNHALIKQRDIALMLGMAMIGMLVSATGGTLTLYFNNLIADNQLTRIWLVWWAGDTVGILLALPLVLNISKKSLQINAQQFNQLMAWLILFIVCELAISAMVPNLSNQFMLSIFLILPAMVWAAMSFGIVGGSLAVIILSLLSVWVASYGYGSFYGNNVGEGIFSLWMFMVTLVVVMLLVAMLQSERNLAEAALRSNDKKLRAVINGALDGIVTIDDKGALVEFNPAAERIFGYSKQQVVGKSLAEVIIPPSLRHAHDTKHQEFVLTGKKHIFDRRLELTAMHADGSEFPVELTITSLKEDGNTLVTGFIRDISQQKKAQQEIENFAYYDTLTNLPNRRLLVDRFKHASISSKRSKMHCALIFADLDNFKLLNDTKGHDAGDRLLVEVAKRIQQSVRAGDTVARLSGDEFVLIIENLDNLANIAYSQATEVAQKLLSELNKSYQLDVFEFNTSASLGIALFNNDELGFEDHLRHADIAMYEAKAAGRNTFRFYDEQTKGNLERHFTLESALHIALQNEEFYLQYQSIVNTAQEIVGAEVLLRWSHPTLGLINPEEFIPIAEKNNLIIKMGFWVLNQACKQIKIWESTPNLSKIRVSVNISAKQFCTSILCKSYAKLSVIQALTLII